MNQTNCIKRTARLICLALGLAFSGSGLAAETFPGTEAGATSLLKEFVKPGADHAALSKPLRPTAADYSAVFEPDAAVKVAAMYDPIWDSGKLIIAPNPGQTEVKVSSGTTDELKSWTGAAATEFPGGWKQIGPKMKPGFKIYRFKFLEPGKTAGVTYDGLIYVNGNWRIFPKAWRAMEAK